MKIGITCYTPFHIFSAINLKVNRYIDDYVDIYIGNHFNGAEKIYNKLIGLGVFRNVYFIKDKNIVNIRFKVIAMLNLFRGLSNGYKDDYDYFYIPSYTIFNITFSNYLKRKQGCKIIRYDDGFGTYTIKNNLKSKSHIKEYLKKCFRTFNSNIVDEFMLYNPELMCVNYNKPYIKMPAIKNKEIMIKYLSCIFNLNKNIKIMDDYDYIFLDQQFDGRMDVKDQINLVNILYDNIKQKDKLIIKIHPRQKIQIYKKGKIYKEKSIPWEFELLISKKLQNKILITINSTACLSNTLIFNRKSKVIFLYKLVNYVEKTKDYKFIEFINKVKDNKNIELIIPENVEEFISIIKNIDKVNIYEK